MATSEAGKEEAGENGPPWKLLFFFFIREESLSQGPFRRIPLRFHCSVLGLRLTASSVTGRKGSESWDWLGPPGFIPWDQAFGHKDLVTNLGVILSRKIRQGIFPMDLSSLTRD